LAIYPSIHAVFTRIVGMSIAMAGIGAAPKRAGGSATDDILVVDRAAVEVDQGSGCGTNRAVAAEMVGQDVVKGVAGWGPAAVERYVTDNDGTVGQEMVVELQQEIEALTDY
jgi:hypothetical protein